MWAALMSPPDLPHPSHLPWQVTLHSGSCLTHQQGASAGNGVPPKWFMPWGLESNLTEQHAHRHLSWPNREQALTFSVPTAIRDAKYKHLGCGPALYTSKIMAPVSIWALTVLRAYSAQCTHNRQSRSLEPAGLSASPNHQCAHSNHSWATEGYTQLTKGTPLELLILETKGIELQDITESLLHKAKTRRIEPTYLIYKKKHRVRQKWGGRGICPKWKNKIKITEKKPQTPWR